MGLFFEVQCTQCGYHETLIDGECGLEHLDEIRIKREFEAGEGNPVYRKIFDLKAYAIIEGGSAYHNWTVYKCTELKSFFC